MSSDESDLQECSAPRAVPHGLDAYWSLQEAFAKRAPRSFRGLQTHKTDGRIARVVMKTPTNSKASDTPLPKYLHDTDMALAVDVAVLWRALDKTTPEHASYTEDKCKFNHDVDYMQDEALVEKLKSLSDFLELKAFLVEVLEPPPPPSKKKDGRASALKRKWADRGWSGGKRLYRVQGDTFEKLLTQDNLKGFGGAERLHLSVKTMEAEPFEWEPADPGSKEPPTMLISCDELGEVDVNAKLGKRTAEGYRMGKGTQNLLAELEAQPGDVMQLRVTKKTANTIWVDLQLKRGQAPAADGDSEGDAPSAGGTPADGSEDGGSEGGTPSRSGTPADGSEGGGPSHGGAAARQDSPVWILDGSDDDEEDDLRTVLCQEVDVFGDSEQAEASPPARLPQPGRPARSEATERQRRRQQAAEERPQQRQQQPRETEARRPQQQQRQQQQAAEERQEEQQRRQQQQAADGRQQQQQHRQQQAAEGRQQQQHRQQQPSTGQHQGMNSGAGAAAATSCPAIARRATQVVQWRLEYAVDAVRDAANCDQRLRSLLPPTRVGHCGALLQEAVLRRWAPMPEDNRAVVAAVATMVDPDADWQQQQEEGIEALRHALDGIGELWHSSIVEPSAGSGAAAEGPLAFLLRRATQECEKAAAALETSPEQVSSQDLRSPLSLLAAGRIGGSPLKEVLGGWESYSRAQQLELFDDVVVAAHQGAWQKLEGRMQAALLELRMQPQPADEA